MKAYLLLSALLLTTACGQGVDNPNNPASAEENSAAISLAVEALEELPPCEKKNAHQLAWVEAAQGLFSCKGGQWKAVGLPTTLAGKDGKDGSGCSALEVEAGVEVTCGETVTLVRHGEKGDTGEKGQDGVTTVEQTIKEVIPFLPHLRDQDGTDFGVWVSSDNSHYWTIYNGLRIAWVRSTGQAKGGFFYYSGADCTGTEWMRNQLQQWQNTVTVGMGALYQGSWRKAVGTSKTVSYQSRRFEDGICANTVGTDQAWDVVTVEVPLPVSPVGLQPVND